jgi:hypothetical protein
VTVEPAVPDYSRIRPLGGYPARRCPVRLQYDLLPPPATVFVEPSVADQERITAGLEFQAAVFTRLLGLHDDLVLVEQSWNASLRTREAMDAGVGIILGGVLPDDLVGRRSGRPDILLRADGGYLPVDVKLHGFTEAAAGPLSWSSPEDPWSVAEDADVRFKSDRERHNALQLAHYWRMLEHHGYAASGRPRGAILDRQERFWWIDLDEPRSKVWWAEQPVTWLERYDHEFDFRRDVALHTQRRIDGEDLPPKVVPVWISECGRCPWHDVCHGELVETDHVSLLPRSTWATFVEHRRRGSLSRLDVARLDVLTARAVDELTDTMWRKVESADEETPLAELLPRRPELVTALSGSGIETAGGLRARLDARTLGYRGAHVGSLVQLIDLARAAVTGPHRRRGVGSLGLPEAAVEVDIDMESDATGCNYLWGVLPIIGGEVGEYVAVDSYDELTDEVEATVFLRLLDVLAGLRAEAESRGGELRAYHWTVAELSAMRRIVAKQAVPGLPSAQDLEGMIEAEWVDLAGVHERSVITGAGNSIKVVAPSIGFAWDVDDAGGDFSMVQHHVAVSGSPDERAAAIAWLRSYNRDDVRATYAIREWLRKSFDALPGIEDWVAPSPR